jgi:pimeloyl-ACP methyl ester carboxylesterase
MTIEYGPISPPGKREMLKELRLAVDVLRWAPAWLASAPRRGVRPGSVILLPGFDTGPGYLRLLQARLRRRGHRVRDWGLGHNTGDAVRSRAELRPVVQEMVAAHGEPVSLVGWSLGGYISREYAREHPDDVRMVVTLGTPVVGGPRYTTAAGRYRSQGHDLDQVEQAVRDRYAVPLRVPVAAIYSKRDGIVAWQACIDRWSPNVRHIEVRETHVGLVLSPRVVNIVAEEIECG